MSLYIILLTTIGSLGLSLEATQMQQVEKPALLLYYLPNCPYCQKVLAYLQSMGHTIPLQNVKNNPRARDDLLRYGGKLQVPCLMINREPLYESDAIIQWLSNHRDKLQ